MSAERQRLPLLLLSILAERPRHGYALNEEIEQRSVRQWAAVGLSSIYQTLEKMADEGLLDAQEQSTDGQGSRHRTVYSITAAGRTRLAALIHASLASTDHQRFDYDLGVGVGLTHLPHADVRQALEKRRGAIQTQANRVAEACEWWKSNVGAWAVLDHQRRALQAELEWLDNLIERLKREEQTDQDH